MKTVPISALASMEGVALSSLYVMHQTWREGESFRWDVPRRQSAFLWFCGSSAEIRVFGRGVLSVPQNGLVAIPQGALYEIVFHDVVSETADILMELCLRGEEPFALFPEIELISPAFTDAEAIALLERMASECAQPERSALALAASAFAFLARLAEHAEQRSISRRGFETIERGILYLERDEAQSLSLAEIAEMCYVTPAYFRRLFRAYAGMSPLAYRTARKLARAKELLLRGDMTVGEIALRLGYPDQAYFTRIFRRNVGITPREYVERSR